MLSIFAFGHYKDFLRAHCDASRGALTKLAEAAGCQRSYLSKVLTADPHLTPDQGFLISRFLEFKSDEAEYFMLLLTYDRSGSREYREHIQQRIKALKRKVEDIGLRVSREKVANAGDELQLFSAWYWVAAQVLSSIPEMQTLEVMAARLRLPTETMEIVLNGLLGMGLVERHGDRWVHSGREFHVPKSSPLVVFHHDHWRRQAVIDAQMASEESLHYTVVQAVSRRVFEDGKQKLLAVIDEIAAQAGPSPSQEAVCFNLDWFKV